MFKSIETLTDCTKTKKYLKKGFNAFFKKKSPLHSLYLLLRLFSWSKHL